MTDRRPDPDRPRTASRSPWPTFWKVVGVVVAVALTVSTVSLIGFVVFLAVGMNGYGSNK